MVHAADIANAKEFIESDELDHHGKKILIIFRRGRKEER